MVSSISPTVNQKFVLFSEASIPKIVLTKNVPPNFGSTANFSCKAELTGSDIGLNVRWYHVSSSHGIRIDVTNNAQTKTGGISPVKTVESLLQVNMGLGTAGTYECRVQAVVKRSVEFNFTRNATIAGNCLI